MPCDSPSPLTDQQIADIETRARWHSGAFVGIAGTLALDVLLLLRERQRLIVAMAMLREQYSIERYQQQRGRD